MFAYALVSVAVLVFAVATLVSQVILPCLLGDRKIFWILRDRRKTPDELYVEAMETLRRMENENTTTAEKNDDAR